jgi:hypothetical protein
VFLRKSNGAIFAAGGHFCFCFLSAKKVSHASKKVGKVWFHSNGRTNVKQNTFATKICFTFVRRFQRNHTGPLFACLAHLQQRLQAQPFVEKPGRVAYGGEMDKKSLN